MKPVIIIAIIAICGGAAAVGYFGYTQYTTDVESLEKQLAKEKSDAILLEKQLKKEAEDLKNQLKREKYEAEVAQMRLEEEKIQAEFKAKLEQEALQAEIRLQEKQAYEEAQIQDAKSKVMLDAQSSPLVKGIINKGLTYWIEPVPSKSSSAIVQGISGIANLHDGVYINGVKLTRTYSEGSADITFNWVTDYNQGHIGRQIGNHLLIGMGSSNCGGEWKPFTALTILNIMYHELGHAMGQGHSSNSGNIMYSSIGTQYEYDYKKTEILSDGYVKTIYFCNSGDIFYETSNIQGVGYEVYVLPASQDPVDFVTEDGQTYIPTCSGDSGQGYNSFSRTCNVGNGSKLIVYNPSSFGTGADAQISVTIYDRNIPRTLNYNFESATSYYTQDYLDAVRQLFP